MEKYTSKEIVDYLTEEYRLSEEEAVERLKEKEKTTELNETWGSKLKKGAIAAGKVSVLVIGLLLGVAGTGIPATEEDVEGTANDKVKIPNKTYDTGEKSLEEIFDEEELPGR